MRSASDHELEQRLIAARPAPPAAFLRELENSLFPRAVKPQRSRVRAWRPLFAAGAVTAALGTVALVLSLLGLSPLQSGGNDAVSARGCVTVSEPRWITQPTLVVGEDGRFRMENRRTRLYREVRRCP